VNAAALETILNRQIASAVKMLPMLLGLNETSTETHGSIQWQIQVAGIEAVQRLVKRTLEWAYNQALQFYGVTSHARVEFEPHRQIDVMVEATADSVKHNSLALAVSQGWIDNDEAAEKLYGHGAVGPSATEQQLQSQLQALTDAYSQLTTGPVATDQQTQDQEQLVAAEDQAAAAQASAPRLTRRALTPEDIDALQSILREFSKKGDSKKLSSDLVRFWSAKPEARKADDLTPEEAAKIAADAERDGKEVLWDLFPELRDSLKEGGHLN